ncbi:MAG: DUF5652 family protein [Patescibacteria group bacterium]|jgi:hypothetical protein|nr:DUF5652 family protein [bacterium]HQC50174.1 DUF5652 family protein [bacterium]
MTAQYFIHNQWIFYLLMLWVMPWKGVALWKASRNSHKIWFIALFLLNTLAVLEIIYIFFFSKKKEKSISEKSVSPESN